MSLGKKKMLHQAAASGGASTDNFAPVLYTGNSSTQSISLLDFQPDFVWMKDRDTTNYEHVIFDSVRGTGTSHILSSDLTSQEGWSTNGSLTSFDSNGFTLPNTVLNNANGHNYVAWCWKAGGAAVSNTDGSITSSVSANPDAGFSIVTFDGNEVAGETVGHGLTSAPELIIIKRRSATNNWLVMNSNIGQGGYLDLTNAFSTSNYNSWTNNTAPTNSVVTLGGYSYTNGTDMLMYAFHSVDGYQKIGTYTGTGLSGISVTTGFQPRFIMVKATSKASAWLMMDTVRDTVSPMTEFLVAQGSGAEFSAPALGYGFNSTGFTVDNTDGTFNTNGDTYIYWAIA